MTHQAGDPGFIAWANGVDTALAAETAARQAADALLQPLDADLTTIAGLDSTQAGVVASDGSGWFRKTFAQLKTSLSLSKGDVGLGNVDNTSDANKPVSTATATALAAKLDSTVATATYATLTSLAGEATTRAAADALLAPLPTTGRNPLTGWFHADGYGAKFDGTTDDTTALNACIAAAAAAGGVAFLRNGTTRFSALLDCKNSAGLRIVGLGMNQTILKPIGADLSKCFGTTGSIASLTIEDLQVLGAAVDDITGPRRSRTYSGTQVNYGWNFTGDLETGSYVIRDVTLRRVKAVGTTQLPARLGGIRGEARIVDSQFYNCYDVGFVSCEAAIFENNRVSRSADNGVSVSQGNYKVVCVGNHFEDICYWAIWAAGFTGNPGPSDVVITGNSGIRLGYGGVSLQNAPTNVVVTGNEFRDCRRGPSDGLNDSFGLGVMVTGNGEPPTDYALNFLIADNVLIDCQRGGVVMKGCKNGSVTGNLIIRPGTQYLSDGTTTIASSSTNHNFGIAADATYGSSCSNVDVQGNVVIDDRGAPYANYAVLQNGAVNWTQSNNRQTGLRQATTDQVGVDFPFTVDPGLIRSSDTLALPGANQAVYARVARGGSVSKIGLQVGTSSGNISVAVYANTGQGRNAQPGTQLATSGAVACPAAGYQEVALGSTVNVNPGDWLAISADNTTAKFVSLLTAAADSSLGKGRQYRQATSAHPLGTPGTLTPTLGYTFVLIGVP